MRRLSGRGRRDHHRNRPAPNPRILGLSDGLAASERPRGREGTRSNEFLSRGNKPLPQRAAGAMAELCRATAGPGVLGTITTYDGSPSTLK